VITGARLTGALASAALVHISAFTLMHGQGLQAVPTPPRLARVVLAPLSTPASGTTTSGPASVVLTPAAVAAAAAVQQPTAPTTPGHDPLSAPASLAVESVADGLDYVPRGLLSVVPVPLAAIDVPFPESAGGWFEATVQLSVFIDEAGVVQRLRVDRSLGGPALESAAIDAFRQARFSPGQVDGRAVRSLIRVEVEFESRAMARTPVR
jgi:TonB family protein